ncbi:ATP-binding cassette domain-containing protein [Bacillus sp. H-16]|uniref:ribosomal protection-like ABC-F family protein n=1 Tax=Alteribacter salitolerans TaxID=2912333 RepID=UPI001962686B|nr:ABC-F family ATP-binding cassette domain-containing protein [Alteribacter salitolerans]MBM7096240.1 ATP-binding cassette domain-containing protein [Alteribacter salitolerans]
MITCNGKNIRMSFTGDPVLNGISFDISEGDRIGIVGRNGSGKTTLMKIMSGKEKPTEGDIHWKKGTKIGCLAQIPDYPELMTGADVLRTAFGHLSGLESEMRALENEISTETNETRLNNLAAEYGEKQELFALNGGYEMEAQLDSVAHGLHLDSLMSQSFQALSGGEKTKVCLGVLLLEKPDLLLLDEPTNHLDLKSVEWLGRFLNNYEGTVVMISHDRYFLDETVQKIFDVEEGELTVYYSNYSSFVKEKEKRLLAEFQWYEEQQKKLKKMREAIKRLKEWANRANPPNEAMHRRARNMERAMERMEKIDRPVFEKKKMAIDLKASSRSGTDTVILKEVEKSFGEKRLFDGASMHLRYQDRAVLIGGNGSGKSTLLKMISGELVPESGNVKIGSQVKVGYLSQHVFTDAEQNLTVIDGFRDEIPVTEGEARHILARFLFYGFSVFKKLGDLSGGERMRLRLAQLMYQEVNLLLLDEPTNHLDIDSREVLEDVLEDYEGTILAVSHDRYFINKLFTTVYWLDEGKLHFFNGDYEWAKQKLAERKEKGEEPAKTKKKTAVPDKRKETASSSSDTIEKQLEECEAAIHQLETRLIEEESLEALQKLYDQKEKLEKKRTELYEQLETFI